MKSLNKNLAPPRLMCGLYSKKEAALYIINGTSNIHSSSLGTRDAYAKLTIEALEKNKVPSYAWELEKNSQEITVTTSANRHKLISGAAESCGITNRRDMTEKFSTILEELISNAIFHSYKNSQGEPKYLRRQLVNLEPQEHLTVRFQGVASGTFIQVVDQGGMLQIEDMSRVFKRCYGTTNNQIESKESGAGLGIYMIFEVATHLKIVTDPGKQTSISCWLNGSKNADPDYFSTNFFDRRGK